MKKRIWMDRLARKIFLQRIIPDTGYKRVIDWATALDVRRVVPMINSRNVIERRWITQLDPDELRLTSDYVWNKAAVRFKKNLE
ncbi:MAG: hypothetical protein HeimC2_32840 [Candidatus Heimdallarchaeota archaeon LC_2]|nr:MAG: hypothetical protein HeimC2_32840 [Candidatus Heimdallarchaeota archaeon LC_2]